MCPKSRPIMSREDLKQARTQCLHNREHNKNIYVNKNIIIISTTATLPCSRDAMFIFTREPMRMREMLGELRTDRKTYDVIVYNAEPCAQT